MKKILLCLLIAASCANPQYIEGGKEIVLRDTERTKYVGLADIFEPLQTVCLETKDSCMLQRIEKVEVVDAQQAKRPHFEDAAVFKMKDGSYAVRGAYEGQHLQPKILSATDVKMYKSVDGRAAKDAVLQGIMARRYVKEINRQGQNIKNGLSL